MHVIVFRIPAQSLNSCSGRFSRCPTTWRWFKKDRLPPYQSLSHFTRPEHTKQQTSSSSSVGTYFVIWGPKSQISRPPTAELIGPHLNAQISSLLYVIYWYFEFFFLTQSEAYQETCVSNPLSLPQGPSSRSCTFSLVACRPGETVTAGVPSPRRRTEGKASWKLQKLENHR